MVRAAAKNHASVAIVTSPARYPAILEALDAHGEVPLALRSALAVEAYRHTAAYDARIAAELPARMAAAGIELPPDPGFPGAARPVPAGAHGLAREGRHAALRREPAPAGRALPAHGPRAAAGRRAVRGRRAAAPGQGAQLQQRPRRVRRGRRSRGCSAARASSSSSTPTRAAPPSARPCSRRGTRRSPATRCPRSGASWRSPGAVDRALAERLTSIFLEVVVAPVVRRGRPRGPRDEAEPPPGRRSRAGRSRRRPRHARSARLVPHGRRRGPGDGARHARRRPGGLDGRHEARAERSRARRPRPRLAPVPRRRLERDPARPRRHARGAGQRAGQPRGRVPRRGRQGAPVPGRGRGHGRRRRLGRVLPVPGRPGSCCSTRA